MIDVYGIPNCNTVKKSRDWLTEQGIGYQFHDFKKEAVTEALLTTWIDKFGLDVVINKRGTTWRKLTDEEKQVCESKEGALPIIMANTSMIKRPVIMQNNIPLSIGFDEALWQKTFKK